MVFIGNGTPESDSRARRLNLKSAALDDQFSAIVRDLFSDVTAGERADLQNARIAMAKLRKNTLFKVRMTALRQRYARIINDPANADVMKSRKGSTISIERLATLLAEIESARMKPLPADED